MVRLVRGGRRGAARVCEHVCVCGVAWKDFGWVSVKGRLQMSARFICVPLVGTSMPWRTPASSPSRGRTWMWAGQVMSSPSVTPSTPPGEGSVQRTQNYITVYSGQASKDHIGAFRFYVWLFFSAKSGAYFVTHYHVAGWSNTKDKLGSQPKTAVALASSEVVFVCGYGWKLSSAPNRSNSRRLDVEACTSNSCGKKKTRKYRFNLCGSRVQTRCCSASLLYRWGFIE